jgi:hypothetical protein
MPYFKELEAALERTLRAEYRDIDGLSPFHDLAGHIAEIVNGRQAQQLAILINRTIDAVEGDADRLPAGSST